jgi:hypothetical protein
MAKKNEKQESKTEEQVDTSVVYDLNSLWEMKFRDPITGEISKVRKAFKPRGKLELYHPED